MNEPKESVITINLADKRLWALFAILAGVQFGAGKLSVAGVENQQQRVSDTAARAVEKQVSIDEKLETISAAQHEFQGEMRYRLDQAEKNMRALQESLDTKTTTKGDRR